MDWRLKKVEDQRKELVEAYSKGPVSMKELCDLFGVNRKTAYKWYNRYKLLGIEGQINQKLLILQKEFIVNILSIWPLS